MIVTCTRCDTEFSSDRLHTHVCPACHFVFGEGDSKENKIDIITSPDPPRQEKGTHRLHDESAARCSFHPDVDAIDNCSCCGKPVCYVCAVDTGHGCHCELCADGSGASRTTDYLTRPLGKEAATLQKKEQAGDTKIIPREIQRDLIIPWEHRREIGRQKALLSTWRKTLLNPSRIFRNIQAEDGHFSALLYGSVWILMGLAGGISWKFVLRIYPKALLLSRGETVEILLRLSTTHLMAAGVVVFSPIIAALLLMAISAAYHLSVIAFAREHSGFKATLKVICYSTGAYVFYFLPPLGGLIAGIWQMVMVTIGFKEGHHISFPLAAATAFLPCALLLAGGIVYTSWAVAGSRLDVANLLSQLLVFVSG